MSEETLLASIRADLTRFEQGMQEATRAAERMSNESAAAVGKLHTAVQTVVTVTMWP